MKSSNASGHLSADPGEDVNTRKLHAAIWREEAEPIEAVRRTPLVIKIFYVLMAIWFVQYLAVWFGPISWNEYESNPIERLKNNLAQENAPGQLQK